jgi:hypothetical protein
MATVVPSWSLQSGWRNPGDQPGERSAMAPERVTLMRRALTLLLAMQGKTISVDKTNICGSWGRK